MTDTDDAAATGQLYAQRLFPLIKRITMKRWLGITRRYGVTLVDIQRNPNGCMNEIVLLAGNEIRRLQTGADAWEEVEEMDLEQVSVLIIDHLDQGDEGDEDDADKSGGLAGAGPQPGPVLPGDGDAP